MAEDLLSQLVTGAFTTTLGVILGWALAALRREGERRADLTEQQVRERDESRDSMRLLLGYRLSDLFRRYVIQGDPITTAQKHEVEDVYEHYRDFGGNGEGTRKYKEIMALKTTD